MLQRCIDGIRRLCHALRPSVLDDLGLVASLEWLLSELACRQSIATNLRVHGAPVPLEPDQELALFRIAQEALHNVERHARADHLNVTLTYQPTSVRLDIEDDGQGFDPHHTKRPGLGLTGMHERARLIAATLHIHSRPGTTHVTLDLPLQLPDRHPPAHEYPPSALQPATSRTGHPTPRTATPNPESVVPATS